MPATSRAVVPTTVRGVTVHHLTPIEDARGRLTAGEFGTEIPFTPKRYFLVYDVPVDQVRGQHAHRRCAQFLVCVRGSVLVRVDDGAASENIELTTPSTGLFVPPMVWGEQHRYSADAVLLVFASEHYDADDYVREYSEFLRLAGG